MTYNVYMKQNIALIILALLIVVGLSAATSRNKAESLSSEKLWNIVNDWRQSRGLQPFQKSEVLCGYALQRMGEIKTDFSHAGFGGDRWFGSDFKNVGENLAQNMFNEQATLNSWLNSPSHRENLERAYTHACIVTDGNFAVQVFGEK